MDKTTTEKIIEYQVSSPGRICLAGEHCDYAKGKSIAVSLSKKVSIKGNVRPGQGILVKSRLNDLQEHLSFNTDDEIDFRNPLKYCQAATKVMSDKGYKIGGASLEIDSDLPIRKGLSSSAAVTVATIKFFNQAYNLGLNVDEIAELAYVAEHDILRIGCGRMDQLVSAYESFLLLDFSQGLPKVIKLPSPSLTLRLLVGIPVGLERNTESLLSDCKKSYFTPKNDDDQNFIKTLDRLIPEQVIIPMQAALKRGGLNSVGRLLRVNQKLYDNYFQPISPHFRSSYLSSFLETAKRHGSIGEKWIGAGGNGSFLCLVDEPSKRADLKKALLNVYNCLEFLEIDI